MCRDSNHWTGISLWLTRRSMTGIPPPNHLYPICDFPIERLITPGPRTGACQLADQSLEPTLASRLMNNGSRCPSSASLHFVFLPLPSAVAKRIVTTSIATQYGVRHDTTRHDTPAPNCHSRQAISPHHFSTPKGSAALTALPSRRRIRPSFLPLSLCPSLSWSFMVTLSSSPDLVRQ